MFRYWNTSTATYQWRGDGRNRNEIIAQPKYDLRRGMYWSYFAMHNALPPMAWRSHFHQHFILMYPILHNTRDTLFWVWSYSGVKSRVFQTLPSSTFVMANLSMDCILHHGAEQVKVVSFVSRGRRCAFRILYCIYPLKCYIIIYRCLCIYQFVLCSATVMARIEICIPLHVRSVLSTT